MNTKKCYFTTNEQDMVGWGWGFLGKTNEDQLAKKGNYIFPKIGADVRLKRMSTYGQTNTNSRGSKTLGGSLVKLCALFNVFYSFLINQELTKRRLVLAYLTGHG